jgi:hypothetical protein
MKRKNLDIEKLKRDKYSKPESKLNWLYSALEFGRVKKTIVNRKVKA